MGLTLFAAVSGGKLTRLCPTSLRGIAINKGSAALIAFLLLRTLAVFPAAAKETQFVS